MNYIILALFFTMTIPSSVKMKRPEKNYTEQYYVRTPGCSMVHKEAFSEEALKIYKKLGPLVCAKEPPLIESDQTSIWISGEAKKARKLKHNLKCCYRSFWRPTSDNYSQNDRVDNHIRFDPTCTPFKNKTTIADEFIEVLCFNGNNQVYRDFHAFVPRTKMNKRTDPFEKPSVIIIGIDSLSRGNFERHMPKTLEYVRSLGSFEMHGLNKIGDGTFSNMAGVLSGLRFTQLDCWPSVYSYFDNCKFLWDYYKERNYTTAFAEESSYIGLFTYLRKGYRKQPTDIYLNPYVLMNEDYNGIGRDVDGIRQCAGDRSTVQILLDYTKKLIFNMTAEDKPLMGYFWTTTVAHNDINLYSSADSVFYSFFSTLKESGIFNKSIILFMSDHGLRFGAFRKTYQGYLEERQPFAFFFIPPWIQEKYPAAMQNMNDNQHKLSSSFDLGATLLNFLYLEDLGKKFSYGRGISLFSEIDSNRTCKMAHIPEHYCTCYSSEEVQLPQKDMKFIAGKIVAEINYFLTNVSSACSTLSLDTVLTIRKNQLPSNVQANYSEYIVLLSVTPGGVSFEGTVRTDLALTSGQVLGQISRTDRYYNNECISDKVLRLYCYCKEKEMITTAVVPNNSRKLTTVPPVKPKSPKKYNKDKPVVPQKQWQQLKGEHQKQRKGTTLPQRKEKQQLHERMNSPTWKYANYWQIYL